ncbi:S1 family peptidase [Paenibacillus sp. USHLN196]|uniref:S1 family peptidase n=1 Tax=Paenibacillus sp. USHLN196 TaxID=3081291 RepID=UPI003016CF9E
MTFGNMTNIVFSVGRINPQGGVNLLGTAFFVGHGKFVTAKHVTGGDGTNLVLLQVDANTLFDYQDTSKLDVLNIAVSIESVDPIRDICILSVVSEIANETKTNLIISGTDDIAPGDVIYTFGFPHANEGRFVLTQQNATVGAKILIETQGIKSKHIIITTQARPGQSGSPVYSIRNSRIELIGMLIGSYVPSNGGTVSVFGIDPSTLHQTTHIISSEYIRRML